MLGLFLRGPVARGQVGRALGDLGLGEGCLVGSLLLVGADLLFDRVRLRGAQGVDPSLGDPAGAGLGLFVAVDRGGVFMTPPAERLFSNPALSTT